VHSGNQSAAAARAMLSSGCFHWTSAQCFRRWEAGARERPRLHLAKARCYSQQKKPGGK